MAVIKPTLTLVSNASTATTDPGPLSVALTLSATDSLTVDEVASGIGSSAALQADDNTTRLLTLKPGEFAWLPWDLTADLIVDASGSGTDALETWYFDRG